MGVEWIGIKRRRKIRHMIVKCDKCNKTYDDFDHRTYCPHDRFSISPSVKEMQDKGELRQDSGPEGDPH